MTRLNLKSTTALAVSLALAMPVHVVPATAQGKPDGAFPCVAPNDAVAENANQLGRELIAYLTAEEMPNAEAEGQDTSAEVRDLADCSGEAVAAAMERGGDDLTAALATAPEDRTAEVMALLEAGDTEMAQEAEAEAEAAIEEEMSAEAEAEAEVAAEAEAEVMTDAAPEEAPEVEETAEAETVVEEAEESVAELAEALSETADEAVENVAEAAEETVETVTENVEEATEAAEAAVGEAGGQQLTDEERQAMQQAEAETQAAAAAAAAETDEAGAEAMAQVETETLSEADVRSSDQEFDTKVATTNSAQPAARNDDDKKRSNFENALLLGLGAVVVGSILNNGDQVVANSGDRVVVERNGELKVLKNDDELLRQPGAQVETRTFNDGSSRSVVTYQDGSQTITVRAADGRVLRRSIIHPDDGREIVLFDDTREIEPVNFEELPQIETARADAEMTAADRAALETALRNAVYADVGRSFSLQQIRDFKRVRALAPMVELDAITFDTGSAAIRPSQAEALRDLGVAMREIIRDNPGAVFLVEGHTDATGPASLNLALSDRRAETVALALTEYFGVPPQNLITQGYGETDLKIPTIDAERLNRRAAVRNITNLLY